MVKNHPFLDGNKRLGTTFMFMFMFMNGRVWTASNEELVEFVLRLASSDPSMKWRTVARWLRDHSVRLDLADVDRRKLSQLRT